MERPASANPSSMRSQAAFYQTSITPMAARQQAPSMLTRSSVPAPSPNLTLTLSSTPLQFEGDQQVVVNGSDNASARQQDDNNEDGDEEYSSENDSAEDEDRVSH